MFSGCCSTFANNPFDMVKTRMQGIEAKEYKSTLDCFVTILRKEGPLGFYKGRCLGIVGRKKGRGREEGEGS